MADDHRAPAKPRTAIELIAVIQEHLIDIEGGKDVRTPAEIARVALNAIERWEPYGHGEPDGNCDLRAEEIFSSPTKGRPGWSGK